MAIDIPVVNSAHYDGNQVPTIMGVVGSAGTADVNGTALTLPIGVHPQYGAAFVYNLGPAGSVTVAGTDPTVSLPVRLTDGTSFYNASGSGGGTSVQIVHGTVESAAITSGTVNSVTTVSNLTNGSIRVTAGTEVVTGGTIDLITTVSNLTNGSIRVTAGTVAQSGAWNVTGTINNGSIAVTAGTVSQAGAWNVTGTIATGTIVNSGTTTGVGVVSNLTNGSVNVIAGTVNSGTVNAGTVTLQPYPATQVQPAFAIGTAAIGTLVSAAGAGIGIYPTSITLTALSGTLDMCLSFGLGSTTNQVVSRGNFAANGGISKDYTFPSFYGTSNSPLTYQILGGTGTASWQVNYITKGTP